MPDSEDDEDDARPPKKLPRADIESNQRLACPYQKICPGENPCSQKGYPNMDRVKAHILKKHEIRRCWACCQPFKEEVNLRDHTPSCSKMEQPKDHHKGFDGTQKENIKVAVPKNFPSSAEH
ncbi:hypothetical protein F4677DRAFT_115336 [Hypoxylon crocopeplum]|nr:hypothetical protein F4677DRAFT_115336 [Hypoxylon crocopeplum]